MQLRTATQAAVRKPPLPNGPTATVYFGGPDDSGDVGLVRVAVPVGASMPAHRHQGSDVILAPVAGFVRVEKDGEAIDIHVGDTAFVSKDEAVSLSNPGEVEATLLVAAGPANFIHTVAAWPAA